MSPTVRTPAVFWRAFFVGGLLATTVVVGAAPNTNKAPPLARIGQPDQAEGREAIESLRHLGITGDYYLEFQLRIMPRRGDERIVTGKLWGGRNDVGPVSRVSLAAAEGGAGERRLLIQNGRRAAAWRCAAGGAVELLGTASLFEPLVPDSEITAFDLMMPFIYWDDITSLGLTRFRGRPAQVLVLRPPAEFAASHPELKGVRVQLDAQFNALMQSELLGPGDRVLKTLSLVDLKKVGDQWIPRTFDVRDEQSRNKTRFDVTAVALRQDFSAVLFEPAELATAVAVPRGDVLQRLAP